MATVLLACLCLAGICLTACATSRPARDPSVPTPSGVKATALTNKALTTAETRRLITLFPVPDSAHRLSFGPKALAGPAMGSPSGTLVDTVRFWRVPMSLSTSAAWVRAHPPRGLHPDGTVHSGGPDGEESQGFGYSDDRSDPAWTEAALDVGIAPDGTHASVWRVDGLALWLNPAPLRNSPDSTRLAVTVHGGCPASDRGARDVPARGPDTALLPPGTPDAALICAYAGLNGRAFTLTAHRLLGATDAAHLARRAARVSLAHTDGDHSCPADFGTASVLAFGYPDGGAAALWLTDSGCRYVSNGTIRSGGPSAAGLAALDSAVTALLH